MSGKQKSNVMEHKGITITISGSGNHFEKLEEFEQSLYKNEYIQAMKIVKSLVNQNMDSSLSPMTDENYRYQEISNIISFIGERGTGKTSAVLSFVAALRDYANPRKNRENGIFYHFLDRNPDRSEDQIRFVCLDCIDGSLLEQGEDIFKIILAQMYNKFMDFDSHASVKDSFYENEKRKLQKRFDQLYRNISEMEQGKSRGWEESAITSLRTLSNSMKLKRDFSELVHDYLNMFCSERNRRREQQFLVLVVDDLDLNIGHGFDMLEKIHRYMMVPQVIVLLALDFKQLKRLCYKHFFEMIPKVDGIMSSRGSDAEQLAQEFIDKVLPMNMRVFMPELWKNQTVKVRTVEENQDYSVKQAVFLQMYRKTGIRFDVAGVKHHFYEPGNMRELTNLLLELTGMESLFESGRDSSQILEICRVNHEQIFYDVEHRIAEGTLTDEYEKMFYSLIRLNVERSARKFVEYGRRQSKKNGEEIVQMGEFLKDIERFGYSYGEILRLIYCWGRNNDEAKEFVRSILAYYSLAMTSVCAQYQCCVESKSKNTEKDKVHKRILEIMNGSFAGSWAKKMFPVMRWRDQAFPVAAVQNMDLDKIKLELKNENLHWENQKIVFFPKSSKRKKEEIKKVFRTVIAICMFFSQPYYKQAQTFAWDFECEKNSDLDVRSLIAGSEDPTVADYNPQSVKIGNKKGKADFGFFNFVVNVFNYKNVVPQIEKSLMNVLFDPDKINNEKISVMDEFEEWEENYGNFVLPLYDVDICYNMMKRVRQKMYSETTEARKASEIVDYFLNLVCEGTVQGGTEEDGLRTIASMLQENDAFYKECFGTSDEKTWNNRLYETYVNCPVISWFSSLYQEEKKKKLLPDFRSMLASVLRECCLWLSSGNPDNLDRQSLTFDE